MQSFVACYSMTIPPEPKAAAKYVRQRREALGLSTTQLAERARAWARHDGDTIKLSQQSISGFEQGDAKRMPSWIRYVEKAFDDLAIEPDIPPQESPRDYLAVNILPSYAGMGGGGNGEGDLGTGLVPRRLVEQELHAKVSDLLLIEARGDSMEPDFHHGDQILIDKRDCDPVQPGSFALWDGDAYLIKLVERVPQKKGIYRVFSANGRYGSAEIPAEDVQIMGRPVWFARRL